MAGKNNEWVKHIKQYALDNKMSYFDALKSLECQRSYSKKPNKPYVSVRKNKEVQKELVINFIKNNIDMNYFRRRYFELLEKEERIYDTNKKYREIYNKKNKTKSAFVYSIN